MEKQHTSQVFYHKELILKYFWSTYLEFLLCIGQCNSKKNWIDKHITMCYNKLNELNNIPNNLDEKT
jgi:hypothetical protein